MKLQGKRALVTGADSGIGQAVAELFAREGADVAITYHTDAEGAAETARRVEAAGRRCLVIQTDVTDPASVEATFAQVAKDLGVLDILVNNAGQAMSGMPVAEMDDAKLELILRVNLMAPVYLRPRLHQGAACPWRARQDRDRVVGRPAPADARERALRHVEGRASDRFAGACRASSPRTGSTSTTWRRA